MYDAGTYTFNGVTLPALDVIAAKGKVYVSLTNINPKAPAEIALAAQGLKAKGAKGEILSAPKIDSLNTFEYPNVVVPKPISAQASGGKLVLKLAPQPVTVVALD